MRIGVPALRGHLHQELAAGDCHVAQLGCHGGRSATAEGSHVPRDKIGIAHDHGDGIERHAEFFGDGLSERSADVLADFNLAGEDFDVAVGVDMQPRADVCGQLVGAGTAPGFLRPRRHRGEAYEQTAAEKLQEVATGELGCLVGRIPALAPKFSARSNICNSCGLIAYLRWLRGRMHV